MGLFQFWTTTPQATESDSDTTRFHPAFRLGKRIAVGLTRIEQRLADRLNQGQHKIGFRWRNVLLAVVGAFFLLYFIALLTK